MEPQTPFSDDLRRYLALARHWIWLLVTAALIASIVAYYISTRMTPIYEASSLVMVSQAPSGPSVNYSDILLSERLTKTYAEVMTTQPILDGVRERLQLAPEDFTDEIRVEPVRDTQLLKVIVQDTHPGRAAAIANSLVLEFAEQNQREQASRYAASKQSFESQLAVLGEQIEQTSSKLESTQDMLEKDRLETALTQYRQTYAELLSSYEGVRLAEAQTTSSVILKEPAEAPRIPIKPQVLQNTGLAAMVGLMLAVGVVFLIEAMDDTVQSPEEFTRRFNIPLLGLIIVHKSKKGDDYPISAIEPRSPFSEAFRVLRTNIQFASVDKPIHTLLVTSPSPEDGKSTVSTNLATVIAQGGTKVTIIDADLRRPRIHRLLQLHNRLGLSDLFVKPKLYLNGSLQSTKTENLTALTTGNLPPNPSELLGSNKMVELLDQISSKSELVIVDTPPVLVVTDAAVLAPRVDGVILVVKPGVTRLSAVGQAIEQLHRVGANILGVVFNGVDLKRSRYAYYYNKQYYHYYNSYTEKPTKASKSKAVATENQ